MSVSLEALNKINILKANIEAVTGGNYENLTSAVRALKNKIGSSSEEQYQVYEVKFDFTTGYIGVSNCGNNIIGVEVATQKEKEDGSVETLPDNAVIKKVEFCFNGITYELEDAQEIDGRDVWVCYHQNNETVRSEFLGGRVVASLYYYNANNPDPDSLLYSLASSDLELDSPIRVYYTVE